MSKIPKVMLLTETSREFGRAFLYGVARYSRNHGPWAFYKEPGGLERSLPHIQTSEVDGIIMRNPQKYAELVSLGLPTIFVIHEEAIESDFPSVVTDGHLIGEMAAEHFLERAFRNFAFCGLDHTPWSRERAKYFGEFIEQAGFKVNFYKQPTAKKKRIWKNEQNILIDWLKSLPKPVALFACNDDRGQHVSEACKIADLKVPDDVAILGVDNDVLVCDLSDPPLSSIALNTEKAGYESAELLDQLMNGEKMSGQQIVVKPTHVVTRQSTDILAINDIYVSKAIRYIRENARRNLQVSDVSEAVNLSRRVLERRFRKLLNRSVHQEIKHIRTRQCIQMLLDTNMSISEIASSLGFSGIEHVSRYFREETGMSLSEFRKKWSVWRTVDHLGGSGDIKQY